MARRINLIPRSERPRTRTDWGLLAMVGLFIVVIFGLGFGYYMFSNVLDERKQELADLQMQTAALEQQVEALQQYEQLAAQREDVQAVVQSIYSEPHAALRRSRRGQPRRPGERVVPEPANSRLPIRWQLRERTRRRQQRRQHNHRGQDVQLRGRLPARRAPAAHPVAHRCAA